MRVRNRFDIYASNDRSLSTVRIFRVFVDAKLTNSDVPD